MPIGSDSLVIVASSQPFITLIDLRGPTVLERFGSKGDGPGEFRRPWTVVARDGFLYVQDYDRITKLRIDGAEEVERLPLPPRIASMAVGCGDELLAIYEGIEKPSGRIRYGLLVFSEGEWQDLSDLSLRSDPLVLGSPELKPLSLGDQGLRVLNYGTETIDQIGCRGTLMGHSPVYIPDNWGSFFLFSRGVGRLSDGSLVALYSRGETRDTTMASYYRDDSLRHATILGDVRIHDRGGSRVWLVHNSPVPLVYGIERRVFSRSFPNELH